MTTKQKFGRSLFRCFAYTFLILTGIAIQQHSLWAVLTALILSHLAMTSSDKAATYQG